MGKEDEVTTNIKKRISGLETKGSKLVYYIKLVSSFNKNIKRIIKDEGFFHII